MKHHDLAPLREQNRQPGSHPLLITVLFLGLLVGLVALGSQSSRKKASTSETPAPLSLFSKP